MTLGETVNLSIQEYAKKAQISLSVAERILSFPSDVSAEKVRIELMYFYNVASRN